MPTVEFAVLADRADAVQGKLYMLGGGWDRLTVRDPQHAAILSVAVSALVRPDEYQQQHVARIVIGQRDEAPRIEVHVAFQAQPTADLGLPHQRALICLPSLPVTFSATGLYELVVRIEGAQDETRVPFHVTVEAPPAE